MSKTFVFERHDVITTIIDGVPFETFYPSSDGPWIKADDAIDREAVLQVKIRTLEAQIDACNMRRAAQTNSLAAIEILANRLSREANPEIADIGSNLFELIRP